MAGHVPTLLCPWLDLPTEVLTQGSARSVLFSNSHVVRYLEFPITVDRHLKGMLRFVYSTFRYNQPSLDSVGGLTKLVRRSRAGGDFLIARGNATYYNDIQAKQIGVTRIGFQTVLSIT